MKRGPKPHVAGEKLMPVRTAAERLGLNQRTVKKLWKSGSGKLGGDLFIRHPLTCEIVLATVWAVDAGEHDALRASSIECLIASGRLTP